MSEVMWKQVTVQVPAPMLDAVSDFLATLSGRGVCTGKNGDSVLIDAWLAPDNAVEQMTDIRRYIGDLDKHGNSPGVILLQTREVAEEDWMSVFRSQHRPVRISERLVIRPTWCEPVGQNDLVLDPGMAFGTGSHFTTRMCLEMLDGLTDIPAGGCMLDLGTGSGILAIAGAFLGWGDILAVDIDPVAVSVAEINVKNNHTENSISVKQGGIEIASGEYDVITANLSGTLLVKLAERISRHLAEDGHLIVSGITGDEKDSVIEFFEQCGLKTVKILEEDLWVAGLFRCGI